MNDILRLLLAFSSPWQAMKSEMLLEAEGYDTEQIPAPGSLGISCGYAIILETTRSRIQSIREICMPNHVFTKNTEGLWVSLP